MTLKRDWLEQTVQKVSEKAQGVKDKLQEKKDRLQKNLKGKKDSFIITTAMVKGNIVSAVKNNPVKTTVGVVGAGVAAVGGYMLYKSLNNSNSNSKKNIVVEQKKKNTTSVAEADTTTNFNEQKNILEQDKTTLTKQKEVTTNPPTFETEAFMINSDGKLMTKREDTEYKKRIEYTQGYPYFGNMLADMVKSIMIEEKDNPDIDYYIQRLINIANGIQMTEIEKNSPEGKEFNKKYSAQYQKLLKYKLTINTIVENYNKGKDLVINTKTKGLVYLLKQKRDNPDFKMTETRKFELSNSLFYLLLDLHGRMWSEKNFTDFRTLLDKEAGVKITAQTLEDYLSLLKGGDYETSRKKMISHTMDVNSDPSYIPQDFSDVDF